MSPIRIPTLSLTVLLDLVSTSGTPKLTKAHKIKSQYDTGYNQASDFYRQIRDGIVETVRKGETPADLPKNIGPVRTANRAPHYDAVRKAFAKWWGRKQLVWFDPLDGKVTGNGVSIRVNPELGIEINGVPHLVKLYFKGEPLSKNKIDLITHLMDRTLGAKAPKGTVMAVLDIRAGRLIHPTVPIKGLDTLIAAELAWIRGFWESA